VKYPPNMWPEKRDEYEARNDEIRQLRADGITLLAIGELYGLSESRVARIVGVGTGYHSRIRNLE